MTGPDPQVYASFAVYGGDYDELVAEASRIAGDLMGDRPFRLHLDSVEPLVETAAGDTDRWQGIANVHGPVADHDHDPAF